MKEFGILIVILLISLYIAEFIYFNHNMNKIESDPNYIETLKKKYNKAKRSGQVCRKNFYYKRWKYAKYLKDTFM